jgi:hypothetical protein
MGAPLHHFRHRRIIELALLFASFIFTKPVVICNLNSWLLIPFLVVNRLLLENQELRNLIFIGKVVETDGPVFITFEVAHDAIFHTFNRLTHRVDIISLVYELLQPTIEEKPI